MKKNFEISMMGELKFFLVLQVQQLARGIFINQSIYALEIINKHSMVGCDTIGTQMSYTSPKLYANIHGIPIDPKNIKVLSGHSCISLLADQT